jgi:hypothetical protein
MKTVRETRKPKSSDENMYNDMNGFGDRELDSDRTSPQVANNVDGRQELLCFPVLSVSPSIPKISFHRRP